MRWKGYGVIAAVVVAWGVAAIALRSPSLGVFDSSATSTASATSPACLPATLEHSARLPGSQVDVSPAPDTGTANPHTQISFLGTSAASLRDISVIGSKSGAHNGRLRRYFQ